MARLEFQVAKNELIDSKKWKSLTVPATIYPSSARNPCHMRRNQTLETFQDGRKK